MVWRRKKGRVTWNKRRAHRGYAQRGAQKVIAAQSNDNFSKGGRGSNRLQTNLVRSPQLLWPDRFMTKLRYVDTVNGSLTGTWPVSPSATGPYIAYRLNSLYDPLLTTSAEQPLAGFNELSAMYDYYRVHAANVKISIVNTGSTDIICAFFPSMESSSSIGYGSLLNLTGNPYVVWGHCGPGSGQSNLNLEGYSRFEKILGSKMISTDSNFASAVNTNPANIVYGTVYFGSSSFTSSFSFNYIFECDFYCEFFGRDFETN